MGKQQSKPLKSVERDEKGRLKSGTPNPGGLTSEQHQARQALNLWLCAEPQLKKGKASYLRLLQGDDETPPNPVIVVDFMNRVGGKVKEQLEVAAEEGLTIVIQSLSKGTK